MSKALEVAKKLVGLVREGKSLECINTLYAENVVSAEAFAPPGGERVVKGLDAVRGKHKWWSENHEVHSAEVTEPLPNGDDKFAVRFIYDVTNKPSGQRFKMDEVAIYTVANGKIANEEFYYGMGG